MVKTEYHSVNKKSTVWILPLVCSLHFTLSLHFTPGLQSALHNAQCEMQTLVLLCICVITFQAFRQPDAIPPEKKITLHLLWCTCTHSNTNSKTICLSALYCSYPGLMLYKCMFEASKISCRICKIFLAKLQTDRQTDRQKERQTDRRGLYKGWGVGVSGTVHEWKKWRITDIKILFSRITKISK